MKIDSEINNRSKKGDKMWAILIDPDKVSYTDLPKLCTYINTSSCDYVLVGSSLINNDTFEKCIIELSSFIQKPILIFPGNKSQISSKADGILLLSLISGRNPDLLIGQHVQSSFTLKRSGLCILPTGYILVEGGSMTSAQYMSNTIPIPKNKYDIGSATALAGVQLGLKFIYMDAGSGADFPINTSMIKAVKKEISVPLFVGGGIKNQAQIEKVWSAGADIVVVGNAIEQNNSLILNLNSQLKCN